MALNEVYTRAKEYFNPPPSLVPKNSFQSLRFLRWDLLSGAVMTPIAFVFALSISNIAHMTLMSGVMIGILACIMMRILGGTYLCIAGAAAALAPILAEAVDKLGGGNLALGQQLVSAVILTAGIGMLLIGVLRLARFTSVVSHAVVAGSILGPIGLTIWVKQIPRFYGVDFADKSLSGIAKEVVSLQHLDQVNWVLMTIGLVTLAVILLHCFIQKRLARSSSPLKSIFGVLPPQFFATGAALLMGYFVVMGHGDYIQLPDHPFEGHIDFGWVAIKHIWDNPDLWQQYGVSSLKLTMVDTIEICATVYGIDMLDKYRRASNPNKVLIAMAWSNIIGSTLTPVHTQSAIPGGIKSSTSAFLGTKTLNAALFCALFMLLSVANPSARSVINHMPLVALSAIIAYTGWKLCAPAAWMHFYKMGQDPFIVFASGFVLSVATGEILIGFFAAIAIEFVLSYLRVYHTAQRHAHAGVETTPRAVFKKIFRNPVVSTMMKEDGTFYVKLDGPLTTFNRRHLPVCHDGAREVFVDASHPEVTFIDYSTEGLFSQLRKSCCGKGHFKLYGFNPASRKGGHGSGLVRYERRYTQPGDDVGLGRRGSDQMLAQEQRS